MTQVLEGTSPAHSRWRVDRALVAPKAFYFCFYAASSSLLPFLVLYYRESGLTGAQIGLLIGLSPIITWLAAPFWGALADSSGRHRIILTTTIVGTMCSVALLSIANGFWWLFPIVASYAFFAAPIIPLIDNTVMDILGERRNLYGRQRVWGAIGWGVSAAVAGVLVAQYGLNVAFYSFIFFFAILALISTRLKPRSGSFGFPFWQGVKALAGNRALIIFLVTVLVASMGSGIVNSYLFLFLADLGASSILMGLSLTMGTLSEIPVFFFAPLLLRRFGSRGLLLISLAAYVVRMVAYTFLPPVWLVLPINLLHGLTFSALWVAGVSYANEVAPEGMGATAQGLFSGMTMGLGAATGAVLGGILYDTLGAAVMFRSAAVIVLAGLLFFYVAGKKSS